MVVETRYFYDYTDYASRLVHRMRESFKLAAHEQNTTVYMHLNPNGSEQQLPH